MNKARGKSGPLFNFDVHDDVRLLADASVEKDESHAGKVVERSWYQRNKHIFPASRWEVSAVTSSSPFGLLTDEHSGVACRFTTPRRSTENTPLPSAQPSPALSLKAEAVTQFFCDIHRPIMCT